MVLSSINDISQMASESNQNKVVISIVNLQKDTLYQTNKHLPPGNSSVIKTPSPLHFNLYLVVAANFENDRYEQGLHLLSSCVEYLNSHANFNHQNTPELAPEIEKLNIEIENLDISELNSLWGIMGRHYLPSVLYKLRAVSMLSTDAIETIDRLSTPETQTSGGK